MRMRILLRWLAVLAACTPTRAADVNQAGSLSGVWNAYDQPGAGQSHVLSLQQRGDSIMGTGTFTHEVIQPPSGTLKLAGFYSPPNVVLAVEYDYGEVSVFRGAATDSLHFTGTETLSGGQSYQLTFTRR